MTTYDYIITYDTGDQQIFPGREKRLDFNALDKPFVKINKPDGCAIINVQHIVSIEERIKDK